MDPDIWGPPLWKSIHYIALNFNPENISYYRVFFENLWALLPCSLCSEHYRKNYIEIPIDFTNRYKLFEWTVKMHNKVNKLNHKPEYTYEQALKIYSNNESKINYIYATVIIVVLITLSYYIKKKIYS